MIDKENLDVRTITLGISLLDCIDSDLTKLCDNVYKKDYDDGKRFGCDRRKKLEKNLEFDCKQTNFRYTNCIDWWICVQDTG